MSKEEKTATIAIRISRLRKLPWSGPRQEAAQNIARDLGYNASSKRINITKTPQTNGIPQNKWEERILLIMIYLSAHYDYNDGRKEILLAIIKHPRCTNALLIKVYYADFPGSAVRKQVIHKYHVSNRS